MKNRITSYSFILIFLSFSGMSFVHGQERKLSQASENYEQLNYVNAQKVYLSVAEKGYQSEELFTKLANSYYFNAQYDQAVKWYERLFDFASEPEQNIILLRYSQALKAIGQTDQAAKFYDAFVNKSETKLNLRQAKDYEKLIQENSGRYEMKALEGVYDNSKITFGHVKLGDTLYYASTEDTKTFSNKRSAWDGLSFLSLHTILVDSLNQAIGESKVLKGELKSKFHESSPVFTADGKTMFFTRSNLTSKNKKDDQNLKIYKSKQVNGEWQEAEELSINSDKFSTAHPALSPDGRKLYFASDRPDGFGASDIYMSEINSDGSVGVPVNLGSEINTGGKETFPFVSADNELYFSSDGHFGLGGLDVFYVKIKDDGYANLLNVGEPVNSYADDFSFGIDQDTHRGFISSSRSENKGIFVYDNIYSFIEKVPIIDVYYAQVQGYITDKQTELPIEGATIIFTDDDGILYKQTSTDEKGYYNLETNKFKSYFIKVSKKAYDTEENVSKINLVNQQINFQIQQNEVALIPGTDLAKVLNIPIIYFDFDKSNLREDAQVELEKLLAALTQYPNLKLEIRSHTDSRGNDAYNKSLSQRRATSTLDYLVQNGVDETRLKALGMGETQLVNKCSNGAPCSAEDHQKNRRSEFIVIE